MIQYQNKLIVGVDTGNYQTKTATKCFTSGFLEVVDSETKYKDMLEYDGRVYALCSDRLPVHTDKTFNENFFILTLFAIAKELTQHKIKHGHHQVILSAMLPPGDCIQAGNKAQTREYYQRSNVKFSYNGQKYVLNISPVVVSPQAFSAAYAPILSEEMEVMAANNTLGTATRPIDILKEEAEAILIDIGGGTTDAVPLEYGNPKPRVKLSFPEGIVDAYTDIVSVIQAKTGVTLPETAVNNYLAGKKGVRITEAQMAIIEEQMERSSELLLLKLQEKKLHFSSSYLMLLGGGSTMMKACWEKSRDRFGKLDYLKDVKSNAIGSEYYAKRQLELGRV